MASLFHRLFFCSRARHQHSMGNVLREGDVPRAVCRHCGTKLYKHYLNGWVTRDAIGNGTGSQA